MASPLIESNKKGEYSIYSKNELLFECGKTLNQMWKSWQICEKKTLLQFICFCFKRN